MDRDAYEALFRETYTKFVAQGVEPNEAAAMALQELQRHVSGDSPPASVSSSDQTTQSSSPPSSPPATTTESEPPVDKPMQIDSHTSDANQQGAAVVDCSSGPRDTSDETMMGENHDEDDIEMSRASFIEDVPVPPAEPTSMPPPAPVAHVEPLASKLKSALYASAESNDYRVVKQLLYHIFSDAATINEAFATGEPFDANDEWWDIDRDDVQEVFALLVDALGRAQDPSSLQNTWRNALETLVGQPWHSCSTWTTPAQLRFLLVLFEHPLLFDPDFVNVTGGLCKLFFHLPEASKDFVRAQWNTYFSNDELYRMLQILQQTITVFLYGSKKMDLVYAACAVLKELHRINAAREATDQQLQQQQQPFATYDEFYNDAVNSEVELIHDYARSIFFLKKRHHADDYGSTHQHRMLSEMSFCDFPFVLDAASKSHVLQVDSELEQRASQHDAMASRLVTGPLSPFLVLKVRRDNIIEDALQQLVRMSPASLKKPLKVKFIGEEGVDEGGVRKEFFQILLRQLLDPAFGMLKYDEDSRTMWFNSDSLEATMEFELIGILLGLAIYNSVILDLHFPHIVYKKLMGCPIGLPDVETAMPTLGKGLRQLLEFDGNVEEVYQRNFEYSYEIFGEFKTVELKRDGGSIAVTNANRDEYVALYVDHILTTSVARQYGAFHKGFHLVCNAEVLEMFRWEELQLLICGSTELDFEALEAATHYEDGFTEDSACIKHFWSVVHEFSIDEKKKLLMFCTGSDRVPIRGLSNLILVISKNGSDSDRLPTAHTCFNHLLLPEYSSREKLKERLLLAINQAEGFGLR